MIPVAGQIGVLNWTESTHFIALAAKGFRMQLHLSIRRHVKSDYSKDFASMAFVRECALGTYVAIAMRITDVQPRWTRTQSEPYLQITGLDTEGGNVGPLRLWQYEEGDINPGHAYILRGLKVVYDRWWDSARGIWIRSAVMPKTIECSVRTACEDVADVDSITQYL